MKLSLKWLSDFVDTSVIKEKSPREYAEALTMSGSKVEGYEKEGSEISGVVAGKILKVQKHPDADKLVVCSVDVGKDEPVQIVTGAKNVFEGAMVPVALAGSTLPGGVKISKGKLRGVESNGMLCSLGELNLSVNDFPYAIEDGIFIMEEECSPGDDIHDVLGLNDTVFEFEITPNRPDCLSVIGLARETAVTYGLPFEPKSPEVKESGGDINDYIKVSLENSDICSRYIARVVKNVKIKPSPRWIRERLRNAGVRPINNIVDITNYVMLEYGHPMHAFDLKNLAGSQIVIRSAKPGETIRTLDDVERKLSEETLVICDSQKPVAIAGVMGGENSGIAEDTQTVVFEAACFEKAAVRRAAKFAGLRTESSARFEKGLDPENCLPAINRACELVELLEAGEVVSGIIDCYPNPVKPKVIPLESDWINRFLGIEVSREYMEKVLASLGFGINSDGTVTVPSFRSDVEHKADLAEEIARFYGYDNIPTTTLKGLAKAALTREQKFEREIHNVLIASGAYEAMTYSFVSPKSYDKIRLACDSPLRNCVKIRNPLGEDTSVMRTTIFPSMLGALAKNYSNRNPEVFLYEIGNEYIPSPDGGLPNENTQVCLGAYGKDFDFYRMKGVAERLLDRLGILDAAFEPKSDHPVFHPGRCAAVMVNGKEIGVFGEVHPQVLENFDIGTRAYTARFDIKAMLEVAKDEKQYKPLPKFPASTRDISVLCDKDLPVARIEEVIRQAVGGILESLELFDVYTGEQVPQGKKSVAYSIVMRNADSTLSEEMISAAMKRVIKGLLNLGAELRG